MVTLPRQLEWARSLQAIAQTGLAYDDTTMYDRQRWEQVRRIAAEMASSDPDAIEARFADEEGHATPKLDVRGVVFRDDKVLLVHERADGNWTLPGGWVDVGETPSEAVTREVREESGYETRAVKLLALFDRDRHASSPHRWHIWKACFLCELLDGVQHDLDGEVYDARWFRRNEIPQLSRGRATAALIERFFDHREHPEWPTDFD